MAILLCSIAAPVLAADVREIVRRSVELDRRNWERARDYTFVEHVEWRGSRRGSGRVAKVESKTYDVLILDGSPYRRKTAENGQPLSEKESRKAQKEFEAERRKRVDESDAQRRKRVAEETKRRESVRAFALEIPEAFNFRLEGEELLEGQRAWVIAAEPRPGYRPKAPRAELLGKFRGRLWIDQQEYQWVQLEAESIAPVSFGWVLARLDRGARLSFRQCRVNSEVWLPASIRFSLGARIALLKRFDGEAEITYRDYRKFQVDSKLLAIEEPPAPAAPPFPDRP